MISLFKIFAIALVAIIIISLIRAYKPEYVIEVTLCSSIILLYYIIQGLGVGLAYINHIYTDLTFGKSYFPVIIKVLAIAYITEFATALCQDAGEKSIAGKVELAGKIAIFFAAIPVFNSLLTLLNGLV